MGKLSLVTCHVCVCVCVSFQHAFVQKVPAFSSFVQQDGHEFLTILLDLLNEELKQKPTSAKDGGLRPCDGRKKGTITNNYCAAAEVGLLFTSNGSFFILFYTTVTNRNGANFVQKMTLLLPAYFMDSVNHDANSRSAPTGRHPLISLQA